MITQQVQIKLNLPLALKDFLESKAQKFDMPLAAYLKHLILNDVSDLEFPTFQISDASEKKAKKALAEKKAAVKVTSVSEYFKNL
ncbi:hypothetical protein A3H86_03060 [Candidatus Roizmanbacteria bacterium RIFCSPLOWO2_02_FULL_41_9]|uniref:Uncharacterized protein n=1 Tax=Candidatus Roizmanbacteria bacterium RIFCSPLOWO2_02_FULL_41_9 TaxID=1802077 RepID=A0A1F7JQU2_9BACT|nr:MAG: hypothetical protein A3H86_03060 [Candidatus Roizmanbacteria bacterium RIFCSPLOWO2_02_FULL_41_9]